jgi:hypothetical protein
MKVHLFLALGLALGLALVVMIAVPGTPVQADPPCTRYVLGIDAADTTDCSDEAHPCRTIQYAIDQAVDGDVICIADHILAPGPTVYAETLLVTRTLTLDGKWEAACVDPSELTCAFTPVACDPARVVVDAAGLGRAVTILGPISPTIDCLTLTGGDAAGLGGDPDGNDAGGGIYSQDAAPLVVNSVISGNFGCDTCPSAYGRGGGIYLLNAPSTATIRDNLIANNVADESTWGQGGGIMLRDSDALVRDNEIRHNRAGHSAGDGGGIAIRGGAPTIVHNDILSNTAGLAVMGNGGGIFAWFSATVTIEDNLVRANLALDGTSASGLTSHGGGIYYRGAPGASATIRRNEVRDNTAGRHAGGQGGGIYLEALAPASTVADNFVYLNFAAGDGEGDGGGYYIHDSEMTLSGGRIEANYGSPGAEGRGGGLFVNDSTVIVASAVFSTNIAGGINGFGRGGGAFISNTLATLLDNQFIFNRAALYVPPWVGSGGGVEMYNSPGSQFQGNLFERNRAPIYGGGLFLQASDGVTLTENTFNANEAQSGGGGYILYSDDVAFKANTIVKNEANGGSGLYFYDSLSYLDNNVIADNPLPGGPWAAAIRVHGNTAALRHNTIARNQDGIGVLVSGYWGGDGLAVMTDTVLVSHTVGISVTAGNTATLEATLWGDDIWANGTDWLNAGTLTTGTVNVWDDPAFVNPAVGDYHITPASFALDAGLEAGLSTDIDGHFRPYGTAPDIGADEIIALSLPGGISSTLVYTDPQGSPTIIQVPGEAVSETTTLVFTPVDTATAPVGLTFAGHAFTLEAFRDGTLLPGFVFSVPITIEIHYTDADIAGLDEATLELRYWDGSAWSTDGITVVEHDTANNRLVVSVAHLSEFGMFAEGFERLYLPLVLKLH